MFGSIPFIPGLPPVNPGLLSRYLPPLPEGVITTWLQKHIPIEPDTPDHPWVLDPFGTAPLLTIEAARAGYRILVTANNPILRLLLELTANPPSKAELQAALAELAISHKGDERLEPHLRALYITQCEKCKREVEAEVFIWKRDGAAPDARVYFCPTCGDAGERSTSESDILRLASFQSTGLHLARALERVVAPDDPDRHHVEEAISTYLPRAVYAILTLVNKLESISSSSIRHRYLTALMLSAFDRANSLWPHPSSRGRPRQLSIPPNFYENNIWLALEQAVTLLSTPIGSFSANSQLNDQSIPFTVWPQQPPPGGGITVFEGRLKDLAPSLDQVKISAVVAAIPRPNQAFWTLSALWAGWLWGRPAIGPFKNVLHRRRYDFAWHTTALNTAFNYLAPHLPENVPVMGWLGEVEIGFLSATIIAAEMAGLSWQGLALSAQKEQAVIEWQVRNRSLPGKRDYLQNKLLDISNNAVHDYLRERGEPAETIHICAAILSTLIYSHALPFNPIDTPSETYSQVQDIYEKTLFNPAELKHYGGSEKSVESGKWWLTDQSIHVVKNALQNEILSPVLNPLSTPLSDRVELKILQYLSDHPGCSQIELESSLYNEYPGLFTPDSELINSCLESYGVQHHHAIGFWNLKPEEFPEARHADLITAHRQLIILAKRLGYQVRQTGNRQADYQLESGYPLLWLSDNNLIFAFYLEATAVIGDVVLSDLHPAQQCIIILPGERANLVSYKLRNDERLYQAIDAGWRFLTFRQLHWLIESVNLTRDQIMEQLTPTISPVENPQMRLL